VYLGGWVVVSHRKQLVPTIPPVGVLSYRILHLETVSITTTITTTS
jgi:hypothetical protein